MSLRFARALERRRTEIIISITLLILSLSLITLSVALKTNWLLVQLAEKVSFAIVVALAVRWLSIIFTESEYSTDTDDLEYHDAIRRATNRIWICQTWLPGIERDAVEILRSKASNVKLLLASFADKSPIYARIAGRRTTVTTAKTNVASSVWPFVYERREDSVRFNRGHHPGWIAVIDSQVFWGPTPVHADNHSIDFLFHRHPAQSAQGAFWTTQFQMLWDHHSHSMKEELPNNDELRAVANAAERRQPGDAIPPPPGQEPA